MIPSTTKQTAQRFAKYAFTVFLAFLAGCKDDFPRSVQEALTDQEHSGARLSAVTGELLDYKATKHEISACFYRTWRDRTVSGIANDPIMTELPDSLDVVIVCPAGTPPNSEFWTKLKDVYVPYLHTRGTKVIITSGLTIPPGIPHNQVGYRYTADSIMRDVVNKFGLDGLDIDVESEPSGSALQDMVGVYTALADSLGPKSGRGRLLTFDTNKTGGNSVYRQVYSLVNYVFLQAYGRGASTLQRTWDTFSPYIRSD